MRNDLTDVTLILDRSGSMSSCREEAENGVNHFIEEQKKQAGECVFSLVQFDTDYEFVHRGVQIKEVPRFELVPRGMTALLDAVGRAINETEERLAKLDEANRPGLVIFVIVTDGMENSSHEFKKAQIKDLIERQRKDYNWQFTFLGANQDAFAEAAGIGITTSSSASYSTSSSSSAFAGASSNVSRMRCANLAGKSIDCGYTDDERLAMKVDG